MTVSSEISTAGPYFGNGSATVFPYGFKVVSDEHLRVTVIAADSQRRDLSLDAGDYSVSGVGNEAGGDVVKTTPLASGERLFIFRKPPFTQETSLENQGAYYPNVVEDRFDMAVMQIQTIKDVSDRSITTAIGVPGLQITEELSDGDTLMKKGTSIIPGPNLPALAGSLIAEASAQADRARGEADRSEAARDIAAGYASDAVSQGNVPIYATAVGLSSLTIPDGINFIRTNGYYAAGDGGGALLSDEDNGTVPAVLSGGATARNWYLVGPTIHCRSFGVTGTADDTAALARLIAYANAKGGHFLFGGCKVVNNGTHIITGKGIWLDSEGSGEILHADPEEPAFIVGSDDVRAERVKITGFRFEMTGENVDLFTPFETSAYIAAPKVSARTPIAYRAGTRLRSMARRMSTSGISPSIMSGISIRA
ncbi:hypothetical protein [Agrobacterium tumefaciens]|uniref:hypothetical protein n=1 Tax=Agrobacterium tumefaciens TaxID=358 RepID=UPI00045A7F83|nr:hypothetical protein [Agrobacterium tumefaciens]CDN96093.1 hypothetical protein BN949_05268 [Agrobacterium tumefaciens]